MEQQCLFLCSVARGSVCEIPFSQQQQPHIANDYYARALSSSSAEKQKRKTVSLLNPFCNPLSEHLSRLGSGTVMPSKAQQAAAGDTMFAVEDLVQEIKENLRLKAAPTNSASIVLHHRSLRRPSPYSVPSRSYVATPRSGLLTCSCCSSRTSTTSDNASTTTTASTGYGCSSGSTGSTGVAGGSHLLAGTSATGTTTTGHLPHHHHHHVGVCTAKATAAMGHCHRKRNKSTDDIDDPYEMLQALIKNNSLVKEAVRRLQLNLSPKQRYFYESDEESSRSPMLRMCQLELWGGTSGYGGSSRTAEHMWLGPDCSWCSATDRRK